jgi:hypothetical protein
MAAGEDPWVPEVRSTVFKRVLDLAGDMTIVAIDRTRGLTQLTDRGADLFVWQDMPGWTDRPGGALELDLPAWTHSLEIWGWDGLRRVVPATPGRFVVDGLDGNETYMIRVPR